MSFRVPTLSSKLRAALFFALLAIVAASPARAQAAEADNATIADPSLVRVLVVNLNASTLHVAFTTQSHQPGPIRWSAACPVRNHQIALAPGQRCEGFAPISAGVSRFCASDAPERAGRTPDCFEAQRHNQTMVETNFASGAGCYPATQSSCVWYDVSVIPQTCTNCDWAADNCKDAGGVSYNVPVQLACADAPTFTCRGPVGPIGAHGARYPTRCGAVFNEPTCAGGPQSCLQAYFFPMFTSGACKYPTSKPQPNAQCMQGKTLVIRLLDGP